MIKYYDILMPMAKEGIFTYKSNEIIEVGSRVSIPLMSRTEVGICIKEREKPDFECREINYILDQKPLFSKNWLQFIFKLASYYDVPVGLALNGVISKKVLKTEFNDPTQINPVDNNTIESNRINNIILTEAQKDIVDKIEYDRYNAHLIHGVTGSGKTEIYLEVAKKTLQHNRSVIYLVPEISLTHQLIKHAEERVGVQPYIFHSLLSSKKRDNAIRGIISDNNTFLIGPRSALFIPVKQPGLIIVDEEHEFSYKQEDKIPNYHLRDMAVLYARIHNIPILLGSATPQIESYVNAMTGKYKYHKLNSRAEGAKLPKIEVIDETKYDKIGGMISEPIYNKLSEVIDSGNQALIFINRKGYATTLYCEHCKTVQECKNCSVPLTLYKNGLLVCHYCGSSFNNTSCLTCGSKQLIDFGMGTERVEELLSELFPKKVLRLDANILSTTKKIQKSLDEFKEKKYQIMVGTQMIAKGLHFPNITFATILGIDNILSFPDFRSTEKVYQLITQVAGRTGRGILEGNVYIQTAIPDNAIFRFINEKSDEFYNYEIERRKNVGYPPYVKLVRVTFSHKDEMLLKNTIKEILNSINHINVDDISILGPTKASIYKIKNKYRYSLIIKSNTVSLMNIIFKKIKYIFDNANKKNILINIDRDPYHFM